MRLLSLAPNGDKYLSQIDHFRKTKNLYVHLDLQRLDTCDLDVYLVTTGNLDDRRISDLGLDERLIYRLQVAWIKVCQKPLVENEINLEAINLINKYCLPLLAPEHEKRFLVRKLDEDRGTDRILLFVDDFAWLPLDSLFMLTRACKVEQGLIPLHVSAVAFEDGLYLFGGPSGAGKSTIANLIVESGGKLLDEDQVIVRTEKNGTFYADAWGYSLKTCEAPVRAVFQLIKDHHNLIKPLSPVLATRFLVTQADQVAGYMLHDRLYEKMYLKTAELARELPAFQLHFTREGGFWPGILEEINV
jgi:hypothetical protein